MFVLPLLLSSIYVSLPHQLMTTFWSPQVYVMLERLEKISSKLYAEEEEMRERKEKKGTAMLSNY